MPPSGQIEQKRLKTTGKSGHILAKFGFLIRIFFEDFQNFGCALPTYFQGSLDRSDRCPGRVGIPRQEQVDALAKASLREPAPRLASAAFLKQKAHLEMLGNWQTEMRSTKFSGKDFPRHRPLRKVSSTKSRLLLRVDAARAVRMILNHAPMGECRSKFFPFESTTCSWCNELQTRKHILFWCTRYQRPPDFTLAQYLTKRDPY